jgi:hypothetical protein
MSPLEKSAQRKRSRSYRRRIRTFWITVIVIGFIVVAGAILFALMDGSNSTNSPNEAPPTSLNP